MSGRDPASLVHSGKQLALICHLCGTYIYFAIFGLGWLRPLRDHEVEICTEKCSAGLADFHTLHSSAVLALDGQEGPGQSAYVLNQFLEGHLMAREMQILRPAGRGRCRGM